MQTIVIIGGGAAGMFAAINAARLAHGNAKIIVLEKSNQLLSKVKVSGGGRCNVTHHCFEINELVKNYPRGEKELKGAFHFFNPQNTIDWLEERGVQLKTEADGRMFPVTDSSQTIIDCFLREANKYKVEIKTNFAVQQINFVGEKFEIENQHQQKIIADKLLIATGGNSQGIIFEQLKKWNHTIQPAIPSLFTFQIKDAGITDLSGLSIPKVKISIINSKHFQVGPMLFTHWGISGPAVLKLSAFAAKELFQWNYNFKININFLPDFSIDAIKNHLQKIIQTEGRKKVAANALFDLPKRCWLILLEKSKIESEKNWADINKQQKENLLKVLTALELQVSGKSTFKEEFVTCGGVTLSEINFKTMESKLVKNLFFAGEVMDVDAITGGFNFQNAWTTAMIVAHAMTK
jgi:predicted Rossmann fold flavoprotein